MDGQELSSVMGWKNAVASVSGTSHIRSGWACQDSYACEIVNSKDNGEILIAIVSDGAGSAKYSEIGSRLICNIIKAEIMDFFNKGFYIKDISREIVAGWIVKFQEEVFNIARDNSVNTRDYACTLVGAIVGLHEEVYFQIGDGAIVVLPRYFSEEYKCIFWPQRGEYENTTFFATDRVSVGKHLDFKKSDSQEDEIVNIAVFTDGIQHLGLHYESQSPFRGFFKPLFKAFNSLKHRNSDEINTLLQVFLNSCKINNRTDDDKTIIMAMRF
jgi:hypothetical protein